MELKGNLGEKQTGYEKKERERERERWEEERWEEERREEKRGVGREEKRRVE